MRKKSVVFVFFLLFSSFFYSVFAQEEELPSSSSSSIHFYVHENGSGYGAQLNGPLTVETALKALNANISHKDTVFPCRECVVSSGTHIYIQKNKTVHIFLEKEEYTYETTGVFVRDLLNEYKIVLDEHDFTLPEIEKPLEDGMDIRVVRVLVEEEKKYESVPYKTQTEEDDDLGWREKKTLQKGEKGKKELTYEVIMHDGKEIKRKLLKTQVVKEPVDEKIIQGTYMKMGKKHTGFGTWYAYTGTLAAASPWLPLGSFVKVTNEENGKSVVVVINDRGPFGKNRIIDLDKVAFEKIASIGAGVIEVKVEEILN